MLPDSGGFSEQPAHHTERKSVKKQYKPFIVENFWGKNKRMLCVNDTNDLPMAPFQLPPHRRNRSRWDIIHRLK